LTQCVTRHVVANNKYIKGDGVSSKDYNFTTYYDANNLYGWSISKPLTTGAFLVVVTGER